MCMEGKELALIIEAILFAAQHPVSVLFIYQVIRQHEGYISNNGQEVEPGDSGTEEEPALTEAEIQQVIEELIKKYQSNDYAFELIHISEGYQFFTKPKYHSHVRNAIIQESKKKLTKAALETLSIIAYKQPITKAEMEFIRGVNCDYSVQKLLDKKLVDIVGRADAPGKPLLYGTSPFFTQYFGLGSISELPKLKEFEESDDMQLNLFKSTNEIDKDHGEKTYSVEQKEAFLEGTPGSGEEESE